MNHLTEESLSLQEQSSPIRVTFIGQDVIPNTPGVYKIAHKVTGKFYVGSSINMRKRLRSHIQRFNNSVPVNPYFGQALKKYGVDSFVVSVLEHVEDVKQLTEREQHWLDLLQPYKPKGYNLNPRANKGGFKAKHWVIFPPNGEPFLTHSVEEYSQKVGLNQGALSRVASGLFGHTKGHWCRFATEEEIEEGKVLIYDKPEIKLENSRPTGERFVISFKGRFRVNINIKGAKYHVGLYDTLEEAVAQRDWALSLKPEELIQHLAANSIKNQEKKTSKYKGVSWDSAGHGRWVSHIRLGGKQLELGRFHIEEEAAKAYKEAAKLKEQHGKAALEIIRAAFKKM